MIKDDEDHDEDCSNDCWKFSFAIKGINYIFKKY